MITAIELDALRNRFNKPVMALDRNLKPHAEAIAAMYIWSAEYAAGKGGSMDFWDSLNDYKKNTARKLVQRVKSAPFENND